MKRLFAYPAVLIVLCALMLHTQHTMMVILASNWMRDTGLLSGFEINLPPMEQDGVLSAFFVAAVFFYFLALRRGKGDALFPVMFPSRGMWIVTLIAVLPTMGAHLVINAWPDLGSWLLFGFDVLTLVAVGLRIWFWLTPLDDASLAEVAEMANPKQKEEPSA